MNIINLKEGQEAIVVSVTAAMQATKRLADLGLVFNSRLKILRKAPLRGPIEIEINRSKIAIGRGIASKILVKKCE